MTRHLERLVHTPPSPLQFPGLSHSCATPICGRGCIAKSPRLIARCQAERFRLTPSVGGVSSWSIRRFWCTTISRAIFLSALGRLEILAALTPKKFWRGDWRKGPRNVRFRFHTDPRVAGAGPLLKANEIGSPMTGGELTRLTTHCACNRRDARSSSLVATTLPRTSHTHCFASCFQTSQSRTTYQPLRQSSLASRIDLPSAATRACKGRALTVVTRPRDASLWW